MAAKAKSNKNDSTKPLQAGDEQATDMQEMNAGGTDLPAGKDYLGLTAHIKGFKEFVTTCATPTTIALQGGWGTGKTTFFQLVKQKIEKDDPNGDACVVVTIETWRFSVMNQTAALLPTLGALVEDAMSLPKPAGGGNSDDAQASEGSHASTDGEKTDGENDADDTQEKEVREKRGSGKKGFVRILSDCVAPLVAMGAELGTRIPGAGDLAGSIVSNLISVYRAGLAAMADDEEKSDHKVSDEELKRALLEQYESADSVKTMIKELASKKRLIIFVDDLDRLRPDQAIEFLEQLKNFMDCEGCVFVLAIDEAMIYEGVVDKYGERASNRKKLFFDKIIQVPFELPVAGYDIEQYIDYLADELEIGDIPCSQFAEAIATIHNDEDPSHPKNPRSIKRLMSLYKLHYLFVQASQDRYNLAKFTPDYRASLFAITVFGERFPKELSNLDLLKEKLAAQVSDGKNGAQNLEGGVALLETWLLKIAEEEAENTKIDVDDESNKNAFESAFAKALEDFQKISAIDSSLTIKDYLNRLAIPGEEWKDGKEPTTTDVYDALVVNGYLVIGGEGEQKDKIITDAGRRLGLVQATYYGNDPSQSNLYARVGYVAQKKDSKFERLLREKFCKN